MDDPKIGPTIPGSVNLAPDMPGYQMRMLNRIVEPGKSIAMHRHEKRPGLTYVLEGTLTEITQDGITREVGPGSVIIETRETVHSVENRGSSRVVLLGAHVIEKRLD